MTTYLALLRGVNVGGKALLKMADLAAALESESDCDNVRTYIQSGNIIFESAKRDKKALATLLQRQIKQHFDLDIQIALFTADEWTSVIQAAPAWWGKDTSWKHNILILTDSIAANAAAKAIGELIPGIEALAEGKGVLYQSVSFKLFSRSTTGKLASRPIYKKMTVRNYNTATKLANLLSSKSGM